MKNIIENLKKSLGVIAAPVIAVAAIWGLDIASIVGATAACLVSLLTYAAFWADKKKEEVKEEEKQDVLPA